MATGLTPDLALPYPEPGTGEPANGPVQMKALAEAIDAACGSADGLAPLGEDSRVPDANLPERLSEPGLADSIAARGAVDETITGKKTFNNAGGLRTTTYFGIGGGVGSPRMPVYANLLLDAAAMSDTLAAAGADDYVGVQHNVRALGDFRLRRDQMTGSISSGSTIFTLTTGTVPARVVPGWTLRVVGAGVGGGQPLKTRVVSVNGDRTAITLVEAASTTVTGATAYASLAADDNALFFANDFYTTWTGADDLAGIDNVFGRLTEIHVYTPGRTFATVKAGSFEANVEASATGTTIAKMMSLEVNGIRNDAAATITDSYGLYVRHNTGGSNPYSVFVEGGRSVFNGRTELRGADATDVALKVYTPLGVSVNAVEGWDVTGTNRSWRITNTGAFTTNADVAAREAGGNTVLIGQVSGGFAGIRIGNADSELRRVGTGLVELTAKLRWTAANESSATPAGATKRFAVVGSDGVTYYLTGQAA